MPQTSRSTLPPAKTEPTPPVPTGGASTLAKYAGESMEIIGHDPAELVGLSIPDTATGPLGYAEVYARGTPKDMIGSAWTSPTDPYLPGLNLGKITLDSGGRGGGGGGGSRGGASGGLQFSGEPTMTEAGVLKGQPVAAKASAAELRQPDADVDAVLTARLGRYVTTAKDAAYNLGAEVVADIMETADNFDNPRKMSWLGVSDLVDTVSDPGDSLAWLAGKVGRLAGNVGELWSYLPNVASHAIQGAGEAVGGLVGEGAAAAMGIESSGQSFSLSDWADKLAKEQAGDTSGFDRGEAYEQLARNLWNAAASGELRDKAMAQSSMSAGTYGPALQRSLKAINMDRAFMTEDGRFATLYGRDLVDASVPREMAAKLAATAGNNAERDFWLSLTTDFGREALGAALDILVDPLWLMGPAASSKVVQLGDEAFRVSSTVVRATRVLSGTANETDALRVATRAAMGDAEAVQALRAGAAEVAQQAQRIRAEAQQLAGMDADDLLREANTRATALQDALNNMVAAYGRAGGGTPEELVALRQQFQAAATEVQRMARKPEAFRKAAVQSRLQAASKLEGAVQAARDVAKGQVKREGSLTFHLGERSYSMVPARVTDALAERVGRPLAAGIQPWTFGQLQRRVLSLGGDTSRLTIGERMAWMMHTAHKAGGRRAEVLRTLPSRAYSMMASLLGTRYFQPALMSAQQYLKTLGKGQDAAALERLAEDLVAGGSQVRLRGVSAEDWAKYQEALGDYFDSLGARDHFIRASMARAVKEASEVHALRRTLAQQWDREGRAANRRVTHRGREYVVEPRWLDNDYTAQSVFDEALRHAEAGDGVLEARPELRGMADQFRAFVTEMQQQTGRSAEELEQSLIRVVRSYREEMEPERLAAVRALLEMGAEANEGVHAGLWNERVAEFQKLWGEQIQLADALAALDKVLGKGGLAKLLREAVGNTDNVAPTERVIRMLLGQGVPQAQAERVAHEIGKALKAATNTKTLDEALDAVRGLVGKWVRPPKTPGLMDPSKVPYQAAEEVLDEHILRFVREAQEEYGKLIKEAEDFLASDDLDPRRLVAFRAHATRGWQKQADLWEKAMLDALKKAGTPEALHTAEVLEANFQVMREAVRAGTLDKTDKGLAETMQQIAGLPEGLRDQVKLLAERRAKVLEKLDESLKLWHEENAIREVWVKNQGAGRRLMMLTDLGYALRGVPEEDVPKLVRKILGTEASPEVVKAAQAGDARAVMDALNEQRKALQEALKGNKEAQRGLEAALREQRAAYQAADEAVRAARAELDALEMGTVWEAPTNAANQMNITTRVRRQANELERAMWQRALAIRGTASEEDWLLAAFSLTQSRGSIPLQVGDLGRRLGALPGEMQDLVAEVRGIVRQYENWYRDTGFDFPADPVQRLKEWGVVEYLPHMSPEGEVLGKNRLASQTWARGGGSGQGHGALDRLINTNIPGRRQRQFAGTIDEINAAAMGYSLETLPSRILARYIAVNRAVSGAEFAQALLRGEVMVKLEPEVMEDIITAADGTQQVVRRLREGGSIEDQALARGLFPLFERPNTRRDLDILLTGSAEDWARVGVTQEELREAIAGLINRRDTDASPFMSWLRSGTQQQSMSNVMAIVLHMRAEGMPRVAGGRDLLWTVEDALERLTAQGMSVADANRALAAELNRVAAEAGLSQISAEALWAFSVDKPWRMFIPARIQQSLEHVFSPALARNGGLLSEMIYGAKDLSDAFQNFWKTWSTITSYAFHSKNLMSNKLVEIMNGGLWGALSPTRNLTANALAAASGYVEEFGSVGAAVERLRAGGGWRWSVFQRSAVYRMWERGVDLGDGTIRPLDEALALLEERGVQTRGFTGIGNLDEYEEAVSDWAYSWRHNPLKAAWKAVKDWGPDTLMASLAYGGVGLPGLVLFAPRKFGAQLGRRVESVSRICMFLTQMEQTGGNVAESANMVNKFLFNYDDLTEAQKVWMRSLFPFFTWTQKNLLLQMEMLREAPWQFGKLHQIMGHTLPRLSDAMEADVVNPIDANDPEQRKHLRPDQRSKYMVPLPVNLLYGREAPLYMTNFATPQESAVDLVNQAWAGDMPAFFGPLPKLAYAFLTGQDTYSGKPWMNETNGVKIAQQLVLLKRAGELPGVGVVFRALHAALAESLDITSVHAARKGDAYDRFNQAPMAAFVYGQLNPFSRNMQQFCAYLDAYQQAWRNPESEAEGESFRVPDVVRWLRAVSGLGVTFYDPYIGQKAYQRALKEEQIRLGVELGALDAREYPRSH